MGADTNGISIFVKNPYGLLIKEEIAHAHTGSVSFISTTIGDYEICLRSNRRAEWRKENDRNIDIPNELEVRMDILIDDLMHENVHFESKSRVDAISNMVNSLTNHMQSVQKQMQFTSSEEDKMREIYESTNKRMWWGSFLTVIVLFGCGIFQILTLKKIMIQKKFA